VPVLSSRSRGDLILALALLAAPAGEAGEGSVVVVRLLDAAGHVLPEMRVVARCPGGTAWHATTDASGFAVMAGVPPCPLAVAAEPESTPVQIRVDRLETRAVGLPGEALASKLPSSGNAWSLLETAEPAAILDRIDGAGLYLGEPGRFSMRGTSWTQNALLLDGVDITDSRRGGTPLVDPDVFALERMEAVSGLAPVEQAEPGVALTLVPRTPGPQWRGTVEGDALGESLQAGESGGAPSIARFGSLVEADGVVAGPLGPRLRLLLSGRLGRLRRFERDDPTVLEARLLSGIGHLVYQPDDRQTLRFLVSGQAVRRPFAGRALFFDPPDEKVEALGAQVRFDRTFERATLAAYAAGWGGRLEPQKEGHAGGRAVERVLYGPVPELVFPARSRTSTWSGGASLSFRAARLGGVRHAPRAGLALRRVSADERAGMPLAVPETVGGQSARVWEYAWAGPDSRRHVRDLAAWITDPIVYRDRLLVEAGLRLDASAGAAEGAPRGVSWTSLLPRVSARLRLTSAGRLTAFGGYAEYRHRLLLAPLAFGDPYAPQAAVYRWNDANEDDRFDPAERGPLVVRVGPGGSLAAVDPGLRPPRTRELVAGLELSPGNGWLVRLTGFDRREKDLLESIDVGVPISGYTVRYLPDPSGDILGPQDDQLLPVYDRKPETFGLDRYLLTNPSGHTGRHRGVEIRVEKTLGRLELLAGGTASMTETAGANRGFRVLENDQGLVGELFDDPNADTHASGRSFFDRAYTMKLGAAYRAPGDWRLGLAARYQDGQPFGRLVVVPDLAQGPEIVPATPRGQITESGATDAEGRYLVPSGHRFTYTLTVDALIEKGFDLHGRRLALRAEVFNLLGTRNEVEEDPLWGPDFRTPTATQPPRVVRLGLRFDF
jgi:hypothetical protein